MAMSPNQTQNGGEPAGARGPVTLGEKYWVYPGAALPEFDSPTARAYRAEDRSNPGRKLFALICKPEVLPRTDAMARIKGAEISNLLPLVEWGTLYWPPAGRNCMATVFERPVGGRVSTVLAETGKHIRFQDLSRDIITPLMHMATGMAELGIPHRNIRPDNLFYMDSDRTKLVVGECVTTPPGYDQPIIFETVERGMAMPAGRGAGGPAEDFYAIGVTLVFLLKGSANIDEMDNRDILLSKMASGSYATMAGKERIPLNFLEPLRGLLSDDPAERWGFDEMQLWLDGRRMTPMQRKAVSKAERPLTFMDVDYLDKRRLSIALADHPGEAIKIIREGDLEVWIRRGFEDEELSNLIAGAVHSATAMAGGSANPDDILLARTLILLDPEAPLRYRGFSCMPDGIGPAMAYQYMTKGNAQIAAEMINREIPEIWFNAQHSVVTGMPGGERLYSQIRRFLQINDPGYGIERCLYETNP
ncbi:MAG: hypothetical protein OQK07_00350, partial [Rhodospirillales bacterium]|nr:hypothetical protein [Rhodospirillales bacterium]